MAILCDSREDSERRFIRESFRKWLQKQKICLTRCNSYFVLSDLRKFAEQHGDVVGWNESNRAYILTHGVRGVEWSNYRHPLPQHMYDIYLRSWGEVTFTSRTEKDQSAVRGDVDENVAPLLYSSFVRRQTPREVSGSHTLTTHHFLEGASQAPRVIL